jgi:outer membrane protein assembly factor BamA
VHSWSGRLTAIVRLTRAVLVPVCLCALLSGCLEEQTVRVNRLKFAGVKSVDQGQLRSVLSTVQSSKFPWGQKHYFTRQQFDADLKRIVAFYRDRGFPDAKVTSFDVQLNQKQDAVDVTVNIQEGQARLAERIEFTGLDLLQPARLGGL